ncbi:MAG: four helix bundle protein [Bacteroidetes bacterium]|nr:four helix bundle protein [Bacteroidota bacterium]
MSTIQKIEDLKVWQKARLVNLEIYKLSNKGSFSKDFGLRDQIRRASVSVLSNIAEGFERNGNKEFNQFLSIAKASAAEVRAQLYVAKDLEYISNDQFTEVVNGLIEVSKMLSGLMSYLKTAEIKGSKFMEEGFVYGTPQL